MALKYFLKIYKRIAKSPKMERGFALLIVLSVSVVIITIVSEILFQTDIEARASIGERNRVNAEMSAITGAQFAKLLFTIDNMIPADQRELVLGALDGKQIFQILDDFPLGGESLNTIKDFSSVNLSKVMDEKMINALKSVPGYFVIKTTDESAKLNLNLATQQTWAPRVYDCLKHLFSTPRERDFLEEKGIKPEDLAANVVDYIDSNSSNVADPSTDEARPYEQAKFTHKPKNGPLKSLEELRRIPGFNDDEIYNIFSPYFTIWPELPISNVNTLNLNEAPMELLSGILSDNGQEIAEDNADRTEDWRAKGGSKDALDNSELCKLMGATQNCPDRIKDFLTNVSNIFKVEVQGVSAGITRTLVFVFDRGLSAPAKKGASTPPAAPGAPPAAAGAAPKFKILYQRFM